MNAKNFVSLLSPALALLALYPLQALGSDSSAVPTDSETTGPLTHVLFTATDIQVIYKQGLYHVCGVDGGAFVIALKDKNIEVPMTKDPAGIKTSEALQLSTRSANITHFKYDRAYSSAQDPYKKWSSAMVGMQAWHDNQQRAQSGVATTSPTITVSMGTSTKTIPNPAYQAAVHDMNQSSSVVGGDLGSNAAFAEKLTDELALKLFDVMQVSFEISAPKPISYPYIVIIARYHEKDDPKHPQNWMFAKTVDPIGAKPQKVTTSQGGFPPGFEIEKLEVHLYENGVEIATNQSENRALLSREEAHEYLVLDYVSSHSGATMHPQVVLANMPDDWSAHRQDESVRKTYYIKVDKDGRGEGAYEDDACTLKVKDSYCDTILRNLLFLPALYHGKAVGGVARVKLTDLRV
ncbi:MAG TPA: hypothetical protein VIM69_10155 [Opitutaceae bacterium]